MDVIARMARNGDPTALRRVLVPAGAIAEVQEVCRERLPHGIPPDDTLLVRVFSQGESRFGLLAVRRRRLTAHGIQPVGLVRHTVEWFYVYGVVAPTPGERFFRELPYLMPTPFKSLWPRSP
jgi:hypothetical protein